MSKPNPKTLVCDGCGISFTIPTWQYNNRVKKERTKFYCARDCYNKHAIMDAVRKSVAVRSNWQEKFYSRIDKTPGFGPNGDCWEWTGGVNNVTGYGYICVKTKQERAHRVSYRLHNNKVIEDGMLILHSCDNKLCVNPEHLSEGTNAKNMKEMAERGLAAKGLKNGNCKISFETVQQIRELYKKDNQTIYTVAEAFSVHASYVDDLVKGKYRLNE